MEEAQDFCKFQVTGGWYFLLSERLGRRRHCFV